MRSLPAIVLVILTGLGVMWSATDGFHALTSEQVRRLAIAAEPRPVPDVELQDQDGRTFRLSEYRGKTLLVDFIYTRCPTLCQAMGGTFRQLAERLPADDVTLLSISFDTARDTREALGEYARWHRADGSHWRLARVPNPAALEALLDTFAVVVIPDQLGGFQHNAAVHVIDDAGRLARVLDYDERIEALADTVAEAL